MELPALTQEYAARLREEAHAMAQAYVVALRAALPDGDLRGVYVKGSAYRPWDSIIDYVPEVSDVDVHVRVGDRSVESPALRSFAGAMGIARHALREFQTVHPEPTHTPRPQLFVLNEIESQPGYLPSPAGTLFTVFGEEYPRADRAAYRDARHHDATRFLADAHFMEQELPGKVIDRPGRLFWVVVSRVSFRVGPAGPRILTQLGMDPFDAWTINRTAVVRELEQRGASEMAEAYAEFYLAGWDGFRSGFEDADAGARALAAADGVFRHGRGLIASS